MQRTSTNAWRVRVRTERLVQTSPEVSLVSVWMDTRATLAAVNSPHPPPPLLPSSPSLSTPPPIPCSSDCNHASVNNQVCRVWYKWIWPLSDPPNILCMHHYISWFLTVDINECSSNPCQNGATCNNLVNSFSCACVLGYTGDTCSGKLKAILHAFITEAF